MSESLPEITQLQQQQALFTQALKAMLEGKWVAGADTQMSGTLSLDYPVSQSELEEPPKE